MVNLHPHIRYGGELMLLLRPGHHTSEETRAQLTARVLAAAVRQEQLVTEDIGHRVLQLVLPYLKSRIMQCRCSLVSQHFRGCMQAYIRQHLANLLASYLVTRWSEDSAIKPLMSTSDKQQSIKWLCTFAGPEAMGRPDVAQVAVSCPFSTAAASAAPILAAAGEAQQKMPPRGTPCRDNPSALLSSGSAQEHPAAPHKPTRSMWCSSTHQTTHANAARALFLWRAGLRLSDECVRHAALGNTPFFYETVGRLLQSTPAEQAEQQHSGLSPLVKLACTIEQAPIALEVRVLPD